ncbi:hypothetical protein AGOR_G00131960 [Albula goreensis]|uniref:Uncharacterized protein n=1 Tax=Albula goreensis TaxID=1534307 RepID=A0A8T3D9E8_9TELE|nr:hypothetical protein AGOR_G00131960 [Albula goreensis]
MSFENTVFEKRSILTYISLTLSVSLVPFSGTDVHSGTSYCAYRVEHRMGSTESSTRKVSFGLDEDDRVRVLRGVKLSEDVLQRMRGSAQETDFKPPSNPTSRQESGSEATMPEPLRPTEPQQPTEPTRPTEPPRPTPTEMQKELRKYEWEQAEVKEEMARVTRREREMARERLSSAMRREQANTRSEAEKAKNLPAEMDARGRQLEKKEAEVKKLHAFYKEKLAQLETRNMDNYKQSRENFRESVTRAEAHVKPRSMEPVCTTLQRQILHCYRENRDQTLRCSDLAKDYMQCIHTVKKNLLVNSG